MRSTYRAERAVKSKELGTWRETPMTHRRFIPLALVPLLGCLALTCVPTIALAEDQNPAEGQSPESSSGEQTTLTQTTADLVADRIKYLHDRLRITPAEEPLWGNVAQVIRDNARETAPLLRQRFR